jgi:hypothetical protein
MSVVMIFMWKAGKGLSEFGRMYLRASGLRG